MNLPIENYLACFPTTRVVGKLRLGPLTIGKFVLLDALGVDAHQEITEKEAARAAYVLSMTDVAVIDLDETKRDFKRFERLVKRHLKAIAKSANEICTDAFLCYVKPPKSEKNVVSNTMRGAGWALDFAEALCADYGWSWEKAINTPLSTVFALSAAYLDRYGLRPNCMDYYQRKAAKERKRHG